MPKVTQVDISNIAPQNPMINEFINLISEADPLAVAEGQDNGKKYVIVSDGTTSFRLTENSEGYQLSKSS